MLQDSQYAWQSTDPAPVRSTSKAVPAKEKEASWLECYKPLATGARRRRVNAREALLHRATCGDSYS